MEPRRLKITLPWGKVSYLEWQSEGESAQPTLVLLHGGGLDSAELSWGEAGPFLARSGYRVIAPDHPGYGQSPPSPWVATQERLVAYVAEFVEALQLGRYAIGGLSLGGGMALGHALERPGAVSGVILLGSYGLMDYQFDGWYARPAHFLTWLMLRTGSLGATTKWVTKNQRLVKSSVSNIIRNPNRRTPELLDAVALAGQQSGSLTAFEQWQRDQILPGRLKTNYTNRLSNLTTRVLIIHGDHDTGVPVTYVEAAAKQFTDARLVVIPGAGHWVQRDRPDLALPAMIDFLSALD